MRDNGSKPSTRQKAWQVNNDPRIFGTIAEIGYNSSDMGFDGVELLQVQMEDQSNAALQRIKQHAFTLGLESRQLQVQDHVAGQERQAQRRGIRIGRRQVDLVAVRIARNIQEPVITRVDRRVKRIGRAAKVTVAMFVLGGSTVCIGFLPGYAEIGIVAPVFNAGRNRSRVEIEEARTEQALLAYEQTVQRAFREVEDALVAVRTYREEHAARSRQPQCRSPLPMAQQDPQNHRSHSHQHHVGRQDVSHDEPGAGDDQAGPSGATRSLPQIE